jgi:hypothetical protein
VDRVKFRNSLKTWINQQLEDYKILDLRTPKVAALLYRLNAMATATGLNSTA